MKYYLVDQFKKNVMGRTFDGRSAYKVWWGRPDRKRLLGRPSPRWVGNIKIGIQEER
jgi:hypothetical protein